MVDLPSRYVPRESCRFYLGERGPGISDRPGKRHGRNHSCPLTPGHGANCPRRSGHIRHQKPRPHRRGFSLVAPIDPRKLDPVPAPAYPAEVDPTCAKAPAWTVPLAVLL